jgi:hypothetical protein
MPGPARRFAAGLATGIIIVALAANGAAGWRLTDGFIGRFQVERTRLATLLGHVPAGDRLIAFGATLTLRHLGRETVELHDLSPETALAVVSDARPTWLVVPDGILAIQWQGTHLDRTVQALATGPGLRIVMRQGPWGLWAVGPDSDPRTGVSRSTGRAP